jgi:hypothetical protein
VRAHRGYGRAAARQARGVGRKWRARRYVGARFCASCPGARAPPRHVRLMVLLASNARDIRFIIRAYVHTPWSHIAALDHALRSTAFDARHASERYTPIREQSACLYPAAATHEPAHRRRVRASRHCHSRLRTRPRPESPSADVVL